ncbi:helix-turn-helix transcriptional regulator [Cohnella pontilimi]|uniref:Helix-turn-helix transcriptional regulator n=1 Tax=Cohnella pontilimi TaxID=2564100 RepID=A0A4U0FH74_9BACL|nr:helix-turn-helix transcriptional regulator [Cohnella pontilimi]TJY44270.1 helix-turn-helix transcriptional regulator [Cohnella pontilimi]
MSMGERLRELRLSRNISQEEVARQIGITRSAYSHYEINNRQPVYETLIKLAAYFDVSLDYIIGGTSAKHKTEFSDAQDTREIMNLLKHMNQEQRKKSIRLMTDLIHADSLESSNG